VSVARVNLLPPEIGQRSARRRLVYAVSGLLVVYVLLLGALFAVKLGQVGEARRQRDAAQAGLVALQSQVTALAPYRQLDTDLTQRNQVLVAAMALEVSAARVLNELSLAFPASASLRTLNLTVEPPANAAAVPAAPAPAATTGEGGAAPSEAPSGAPVAPAPAAPATSPLPDPSAAAATVVGGVTYDGYSVDEYAPGVQTLLVNLSTVPGFADPLALSAQAELVGTTEVTGFSGVADLTGQIYTRRYERGLSLEGLR
jgi:hypothetical protein